MNSLTEFLLGSTSDPLILVTCQATTISCFKKLLSNNLLFHVQSSRKSNMSPVLSRIYIFLLNDIDDLTNWRVQFSIIRGWALTLLSLTRNCPTPRLVFLPLGANSYSSFKTSSKILYQHPVTAQKPTSPTVLSLSACVDLSIRLGTPSGQTQCLINHRVPII